MYDYLKPTLKRKTGFLVLHIDTNDNVKSAPNEIFDNALTLIRFAASQREMCKVFVSTLTMRADSSKNENAVQRVNEIFEELNIPLVKYFNLFRKHLGIRGLYLNERETSRFAMNYMLQ